MRANFRTTTSLAKNFRPTYGLHSMRYRYILCQAIPQQAIFMAPDNAPPFKVGLTADGYHIALPAHLLAEFPNFFRAKLTLVTAANGGPTSTIIGLGKKHEELSIGIATHERLDTRIDLAHPSLRLNLSAVWMEGMIDRSDFLATDFDSLTTQYRLAPGERRCSGCPRDPSLKVDGSTGDDSICYCVLRVLPPP